VEQVLEFLSNHGSTIVILLKNDADHTSLEILDEIYLIIKLCTSIFPSVPKSELVRVYLHLHRYHWFYIGLVGTEHRLRRSPHCNLDSGDSNNESKSLLQCRRSSK